MHVCDGYHGILYTGAPAETIYDLLLIKHYWIYNMLHKSCVDPDLRRHMTSLSQKLLSIVLCTNTHYIE